MDALLVGGREGHGVGVVHDVCGQLRVLQILHHDLVIELKSHLVVHCLVQPLVGTGTRHATKTHRFYGHVHAEKVLT